MAGRIICQPLEIWDIQSVGISMSFVNTKAIVIRAFDTGEGDRAITLIAKGIGKINVYAGGVRKTKSKNSAGTDIFAYSDFNLYVQSGKYRLNSAELIESFYNLRNDIFAITYASHLAEIMGDMVQEEQQADDMLLLFLCALYMLAEGAEPELVGACFEFKMACLNGFIPEITACRDCGVKLTDAPYYFDLDEYSVMCKDCGGQSMRLIPIGEGCLRALKYVATCDIRKTYKFTLDDVSKKQFINLSRRIIQKVNEREYHKLDYLDKLRD